MGAIIYNTGGILIDNGWIIILGSGSERMKRNIADWNRNRVDTSEIGAPLYYLIADYAIGGIFAVNGGGFGRDMGNVYYFAPDNLRWEALNITYTGFLDFCFAGDIAKFYAGSMWPMWTTEIKEISTDQVMTFYPYFGQRKDL